MMQTIASTNPTDWIPSGTMPDPNDEVFFPLMPQRMVDAIAVHAVKRSFEPGDMLFAHGVRNAPFFVVESGRAVFFDRNRTAEPNTYFSQVFAGMFIGDTSMFTGEPTVAECRAFEPVEALELRHDQLREFVRTDSEASDLILRTLMARRAWLEGHGYGLVQLIGPPTCPNTLHLREFFDRNQIPFTWRNTAEDRDAAALVGEFGVCSDDYPVLTSPKGVYKNPPVRDIANCIGLLPELSTKPYDLVIVGAGPGGLATAVYGASEGLNTLLLDSVAPGGQAGTSSKIENYLGFTTGISGRELSRQAVLQARKFGATICNPVRVTEIECDKPFKTLTLDDGQRVTAKSVVLATGARYRRLTADGCERFDGTHVFYAAGHMEAMLCRSRPVIVVGGGNSAGQAAIFLSQHTSKVWVLIRRPSLSETMSQYLIDRIERTSNIELLCETEIKRLDGEEALEEAVLSCAGTPRTIPCAAVFAMIGAAPHTEWLQGCCGLDGRGFVPTGGDAMQHPEFATHWGDDARIPYHLETTRPGVFAVGDVRSGSVKRVATAVGEGAMAVTFAHAMIREIR